MGSLRARPENPVRRSGNSGKDLLAGRAILRRGNRRTLPDVDRHEVGQTTSRRCALCVLAFPEGLSNFVTMPDSPWGWWTSEASDATYVSPTCIPVSYTHLRAHE